MQDKSNLNDSIDVNLKDIPKIRKDGNKLFIQTDLGIYQDIPESNKQEYIGTKYHSFNGVKSLINRYKLEKILPIGKYVNIGLINNKIGSIIIWIIEIPEFMIWEIDKDRVIVLSKREMTKDEIKKYSKNIYTSQKEAEIIAEKIRKAEKHTKEVKKAEKGSVLGGVIADIITTLTPKKKSTKTKKGRKVPKSIFPKNYSSDGKFKINLNPNNEETQKSISLLLHPIDKELTDLIDRINNSESLQKQFILGIGIEMEHTSNEIVAMYITLHHLLESDYYYDPYLINAERLMEHDKIFSINGDEISTEIAQRIEIHNRSILKNSKQNPFISVELNGKFEYENMDEDTALMEGWSDEEILEEFGGIIAYMWTTEREDNVLEVLEVWVNPDYRRLNIADFMMNEMTRMAKKHKKDIKIIAQPFERGEFDDIFNDLESVRELIKFYEKYGFSRLGTTLKMNEGGYQQLMIKYN